MSSEKSFLNINNILTGDETNIFFYNETYLLNCVSNLLFYCFRNLMGEIKYKNTDFVEEQTLFRIKKEFFIRNFKRLLRVGGKYKKDLENFNILQIETRFHGIIIEIEYGHKYKFRICTSDVNNVCKIDYYNRLRNRGITKHYDMLSSIEFCVDIDKINKSWNERYHEPDEKQRENMSIKKIFEEKLSIKVEDAEWRKHRKKKYSDEKSEKKNK